MTFVTFRTIDINDHPEASEESETEQNGEVSDTDQESNQVEPQKDEDEKRKRESGDSASAMGDFGGDYGDYLKLLESNSALGFNPQADPIGDNQVSNESLIFNRKLGVSIRIRAERHLPFSFPGK